MTGVSSKAAGGLQNKYKFNSGCELEDELGLESYSTFFRRYDAQVGRFNGVDVLAEATYDYSPFQFGGNNPFMFNDPTGALLEPFRSEDLNKLWSSNHGGTWNPGSGNKFFSSEAEAFGWGVGYMNANDLWGTQQGWAGSGEEASSNFLNSQNTGNGIQGYNYVNEDFSGAFFTRSFIGTRSSHVETYFYAGYGDVFDFDAIQRGFLLYTKPVKEQILDVVQGSLDLLGSTEIPVISQIADLGSAGISAYRGDYEGALLSLGGAIIPGLSQMKLARQVHHLIPNQVFRSFKMEMKGVKWVQSHRKNLMDLPFPFHATHPRYNTYVRQRVSDVLNNNEGLNGLIELQNELRNNIQKFLNNGGDKLNNLY